ncbi:MAG: helix-turn-helix transcriptional regulator [Bacteroidota bacterium]
MKSKQKKKATSPDMIALGKRMKELRIKAGHKSHETFAYQFEINRVLYGDYEAGKGNITYKNLMKIIRGLGVSVKEFFSEGFE